MKRLYRPTVASVARIDLRLDGEIAAGAAFRTTAADAAPFTLEVDPGACVDLRPQQGALAVFLTQALGTGWVLAHEAAQRALDLAAFTNAASLSLVAAHDSFVQWWRDEGAVVVRLLITREVGVNVGASLSVKPSGEPVPPASPPPRWTPALRFFRLAQLEDDVFDAYRNMFLALEAVLSERVSGGPGRERAWLEFALRHMTDTDVVDLGGFIEGSVDDHVTAFLDQQYTALRCAVFHAKGNRPILLPGTAEMRETVSRALGPLSRLVTHLTRDVANANRASGGMTYAGFEALFVAPKVESLVIELVRREGEVTMERVPLQSGYLGSVPEAPGEHAFAGRIEASIVAGREFDGVRVTASGGGGLAAGPFDETFDVLPIELSGADLLEVLFIFALNNTQLPRVRFPR